MKNKPKRKSKYFTKCVPKKARKGTGNTLTRVLWPIRCLTLAEFARMGADTPLQKKLTFESMTALYVGNYHVRVWRTEPNAGDQTRADIVKVGKSVRYLAGQAPAVIIKEFAALPNVSAVEATDHEGNGVLVYVDWPL